METYKSLIKSLHDETLIKTPALLSAFLKIERHYFIHEDDIPYTGDDKPISIGFGQTNSQPRTVAMMLEWLQPQTGQTILDIGCGSGWTSALLGHITGPSGQVIGLERIPELAQFCTQNIERFNMTHVRIQTATNQLGLPGQTFDRILVSAAAESFPDELINQLNPNGIMVIPVTNDIVVIKKTEDGTCLEQRFSGFRFVPLIY
ncbi:MAG: protein-L-isoaspartate O-methyltransferase [Candidatus Margulisiibacteriota bacterium]|nr:protein-L-isoaspartate O-methyltransferase [Candidatus Margulisiibacteriota bacterium]